VLDVRVEIGWVNGWLLAVVSKDLIVLGGDSRHLRFPLDGWDGVSWRQLFGLTDLTYSWTFKVLLLSCDVVLPLAQDFFIWTSLNVGLKRALQKLLGLSILFSLLYLLMFDIFFNLHSVVLRYISWTLDKNLLFIAFLIIAHGTRFD
jgi:hypothetical protein